MVLTNRDNEQSLIKVVPRAIRPLHNPCKGLFYYLAEDAFIPTECSVTTII